MLLGRDHERQEIEQALARARSGTSATLALVGGARNRQNGAARARSRDAAAGARHRVGGEDPARSLLELIRPAWSCSNGSRSPQAAALRAALTTRSPRRCRPGEGQIRIDSARRAGATQHPRMTIPVVTADHPVDALDRPAQRLSQPPHRGGPVTRVLDHPRPCLAGVGEQGHVLCHGWFPPARPDLGLHWPESGRTAWQTETNSAY